VRTDDEIWREALNFRIEECVGFWSNFGVAFPFGRMIELHPDDGPCIVMDADLERWNPTEVLTETENFTSRLGLKCGFQFSSAWRGDIAKFKAHLLKSGYQPALELYWMIKEDFGNIDEIGESELIIDQSPDSATVADLFRKTFNSSQAVSERLKRRLDRGGSINVGFVVARTKAGQAVGFSGYSQRGPICHFHTLGTLKDYRRHGAARHMAKVRYQMMKDRGMEWSYAFVAKQNTPSIEHAKALGLRFFQETSLWAKPRG
jgi:ribosomal protein S18 acetylase RimI-like enzyme